MGFIAKRRTERLMSPDVVRTSIGPARVLELVDEVARTAPVPKGGLVNDIAGRAFSLDTRSAGPASAEVALTLVSRRTGEPSRSVIDNQFLVVLVVAEATEDGGCRTTITTTHAATADGKLYHAKTHEAIRDGLIAAFRRDDPGLRLEVSRHTG
jgi:hypothetical protein